MGTYQEQLALLEQILKNQWPIGIRRADDQEIIMRGKEEFRREAGKLEFNVELEAAAPAIDIATYGLTLNFKTGAGGKGEGPRYREAQSWGWANSRTVALGVGINPVDLPPGRHSGTWVVVAFVKNADGSYKAWLAQKNFQFEV